MTFYIILSVLAFILSIVCGFIFIPEILNFCKKKNLYDIPNARKVHKNAIPRLGGLSFLPSMLIASIITIVILAHTLNGRKIEVSLWSLYFLASLIIIYSVGLIDDIFGLKPVTKFVAQIIAAGFLPFSGLYINTLYGLFGIHEIPFIIGAPLTVLLIVFIDNAMNLIDGIDGLSGGLSLIALSGFYYCFLREGLWSYFILIAGLMGVLIPYLYFNIWGNPDNNRKIFMGDSGSLTLGFILGFLLIKFSMDNPCVMPFRKDSLLLSYTLLIVPAFDVVRVIIVRIHHHKPIFCADKNHIHHKLMRSGMNPHQALVTILLFSIFYIAFNIILYPYITGTSIVIIDIAIYILFHMGIDWLIRKRGNKVYIEV